MLWFFIAIIGPLLYAITNYTDKILLEKYFKHSGVGTLILFSTLLSFIALPIFYVLDPLVLQVGLKNIIVMCTVGAINIALLWCYLLAMQQDEASIVIVFYQLVPVFGLILGYFVLGETVTLVQLLAMIIIICGTTIISFEIDEENAFRIRRRTIGLMLTASFLWALGSVIFKFVALEEAVWRTLFWEHLMLIVIGFFVFALVPVYRKNFLLAVRDNSKGIIAANVFNEITYMAGNAASAYAYLLAPIALVLLVNSFQPILVLAIGILLTLYFPSLAVEKIRAQHMWQKLFAIIVTGVGTVMLLYQ